MTETEWRQKAIDMAFTIRHTNSNGGSAYESILALPENQRDESMRGLILEAGKYRQRLASLDNNQLVDEIQKQFTRKEYIREKMEELAVLEEQARRF